MELVTEINEMEFLNTKSSSTVEEKEGGEREREEGGWKRRLPEQGKKKVSPC